MSEEKRGFAVSDRRHFTPEGETRESSEGRDSAGGEAAENRGETASGVEEGPDLAQPMDEGVPADLAGLFVSLATQVSLLLAGGKDGPDLKGARHFIGVLEMLRDKTQGNRNAAEDQILEGVLYELRMGYLERARAGSQ